MSNLRKRALFCLALFTLATPALAGTVGESDRIGCDWAFSGTIEKGDRAAIDALPDSAEGLTLCFDSPGGSLLEGERIFYTLLSRNIRARVPADAACLSACAIAFLGGSVAEGTSFLHSRYRSIDTRGRLGFHAPSLVLPDTNSYSGAAVSKAYALAIKSAGTLFEITSQTDYLGQDFLNAFLYRNIIETPPAPEDMFYIDTVGKAVLADIQVSNVRYPIEIQQDHFENICDAAYLRLSLKEGWGLGRYLEDFDRVQNGWADGDRYHLAEPDANMARRAYIRDYPHILKFHEYVCMVSDFSFSTGFLNRQAEDFFVTEEDHITVEFQTTFVEDIATWSPDSNAELMIVEVAPIAVFDPETRLSDLALTAQ